MITVNGQPRPVPAGTVVATVVTELIGRETDRGIAVALNGAVVPRAAWPTEPVRPGDQIEVLTATPGG